MNLSRDNLAAFQSRFNHTYNERFKRDLLGLSALFAYPSRPTYFLAPYLRYLSALQRDAPWTMKGRLKEIFFIIVDLNLFKDF